MKSAVRFQLKEAILKALREELRFSVQDGDYVREMIPEAIVFRRNSVIERPHEQFKENEILPGIFVSAPYSESVNPEDGENARDVWPYSWLIQIVDQENFEREGNEDTYWQWQEQIALFFMYSEYFMSLDLGENICVKSVIVSMVDEVDERKWIRSSLFQSGVTVTINVLRPRGLI